MSALLHNKIPDVLIIGDSLQFYFDKLELSLASDRFYVDMYTVDADNVIEAQELKIPLRLSLDLGEYVSNIKDITS